MADSNLERALGLHRAGKIKQAAALYRAILKKQPGHAEALYRLGLAMAQSGKFAEAARWVAKAVARDPDFAQGHFDLGSLYAQLGRYSDAAASFERTVALDPGHAGAWHNLGLALDELGRHEDGLAALDRALALDPAMVNAEFNRGNVFKKLQRYEQAIACYRAALAVQPDHVQALNNLGNALYESRQTDAAAEAFRAALALKPDYASAYFNLADLEKRRNCWREAAWLLDQLIEVEPDYPFALGARMAVAMNCCDWDTADALRPRVIKAVRAGKPAMDPFSFLGMSTDPADQLACARTWVAHECPPAPAALWNGERYRHDKIRVAYLSADFHDHPMAHLMSGVFEHHDRDAFEITAVAFDAFEQSPLRARLEKAFDRFVVADRMGDVEVAQLLRDMEIDIAIDRKGFTENARTGIFARRPAPIQVNYLAYPGTMGAPYIDYILADRFVIPEGEEKFYGEKVVRLPDSYQANDSRRPIADATPSRAEAGLPESGFVFCSFNNSYKITHPIFDLWMELLGEIEGSVLWLYRKSDMVVENLRKEAAARNIAPDRLVFGGHMKNPEHLARLRLADLSLDTLPYGAHTTASDSLYAGVPIITCPGTTFAGRVTAGLLDAFGCPELVCASLDDYRALALAIAGDRERTDALKAKVARNLKTEALFDTARMCRHIEAAYRIMWERHRQGQAPAAFDLPPG